MRIVPALFAMWLGTAALTVAQVSAGDGLDSVVKEVSASSYVPMDERCGPLWHSAIETAMEKPSEDVNARLREEGCAFDDWSGVFPDEPAEPKSDLLLPSDFLGPINITVVPPLVLPAVPEPQLQMPVVPLPRLRPPMRAAVEYYGGFAYLHLESFLEPDLAFQKAVRVLTGKPPPGIILDLRRNPGGHVYVAEQVLDVFAPEEGKTGVTFVTRNALLPNYVPRAPGPLAHIPMVVLVDNGSASCAEMVASALRYWYPQTVRLEGTRTYGKAAVQSVQTWQYQGQSLEIKVTIGYFYPGTDTSVHIHGVGLSPDISNGGDESQDMALAAGVLRGLRAQTDLLRAKHLGSAESISQLFASDF